MRLLFALVFLFQCPAFAKSDSPASLGKIRTLLRQYKIVDGNFQQVRSVKDLGVQLHSKGTFRFELPLQLHWMQAEPFPLDLLMTPEKMVQKTQDSEQVITKESQPVIFMFSSSFLGVFSGDETRIRENFDYQISWVGSRWTVKLVPTQDLFKKAISEVVIQGSKFVDHVLVQEKSGSSTQMTFSQVKGK